MQAIYFYSIQNFQWKICILLSLAFVAYGVKFSDSSILCIDVRTGKSNQIWTVTESKLSFSCPWKLIFISMCQLTVLYNKMLCHIKMVFVMVVNSSYFDCRYFWVGFFIQNNFGNIKLASLGLRYSIAAYPGKPLFDQSHQSCLFLAFNAGNWVIVILISISEKTEKTPPSLPK